MVPMGRGTPVGAIGTYWADQHTVSDDEIELLESLASAASGAVARVGPGNAPSEPSAHETD
jgi:hypothetical protein